MDSRRKILLLHQEKRIKMIELKVKHYRDLTIDELHDIYRLRAEVFVVGQNCVYQDIDGKDKTSYHLWMHDEGGIQAYLRVLPPGATFEDASIGRVLSIKRRQGLATTLVKEGIKVAKEKFMAERITIEAQHYVRSLYDKLGFKQVSDVFMEEGIPHIKMTLETLK